MPKLSYKIIEKLSMRLWLQIAIIRLQAESISNFKSLMIILAEKLPKFKLISMSLQCWLTLITIMAKKAFFKSVLVNNIQQHQISTSLLANFFGLKNLFYHLFQIYVKIKSWRLKYLSTTLMLVMVSYINIRSLHKN